jgi:hypothetical protein
MTKTEKLGALQVLNKADWEGGILEAMGWISFTEIEDPILAERWSIVQGLWDTLEPLVDKLYELLFEKADEAMAAEAEDDEDKELGGYG